MFQLNHTAEITSINIAKGKGDEAPVCVTVGLNFDSVGKAPAAGALGCTEPDLDVWFSQNGDPLFSGITHIETWAEYEDQHELAMLGFRCKASKVSKIRLRPRGNRNFALTCNIQFQDPPDHVIEKIASSLHDSKMVKLEQQAQLDLSVKDEAA